MVYVDDNQDSFLNTKSISEATQQKVDTEIKSILDTQYKIARKLIEKNKRKVEVMAKALLEFETIDSEQIADVMAGKKVRAPKPSKGSEKPPKDKKGPTIGPDSLATQPAAKNK